MIVKEIWLVRHGLREDFIDPNPHLPTNHAHDTSLSEPDNSIAEWHGLAHEKCLPPAPVMQVVMLDGGMKLTK
ncbi:hypothetical protein G6F57_005433 [Rhizopus arrhizus]|uniref:Phosphoglycerate mutase n=1 Tax=Rhizopus oryzae TaxID=64495 RepID=A0A9P6XE69_RHIOR|nr:hypothetical protein G6F23_004413 [Rhizopus arrhizus]KAG1420838.1 hypothetical protein G6F58_004012 [Rhizopus delemar]KAG0768778.1 hypothetical protein G6F24_001638 [Rhizopus arrhizus]KAG0791888.1 hypothetical protein G6F21_004753 [Rhizopus arrhizus]KAG0800857.1 hypothetical protein G6F22_001815 [Rhizopus arrhizus]